MSSSLSRSECVALALIARYGPLTPYELKARVAQSVGFFWPIPHAQLYRDAPRLAEIGLLHETTEDSGRRRRRFSITPAGSAALHDWLATDHDTPTQIRDPALLKLAFAGLGTEQDLAALASAQADQHRGWLEEYARRLQSLDPDDSASPDRRRVLALGQAIEDAYARFWSELRDGA
jgi:DNA-binding PadR family transcriptional regulator